MISKNIFDNIFKWVWVLFLSQLNGLIYFSLIPTIPLTVNHLFLHGLMISNIAMYHLQFN